MQHPNITRLWREYEIEKGVHKTILVVETDLVTMPNEPGFDAAKFDDLVDAAVALVRQSMVLDAVRVVPKGKG